MRAEIIAIGTELLLGQTTNTNARFLAEKLAEKGIDVYWQSVVGDNAERLKAALLLALSRSDIIITSGGLGPTMDDLTKETAASVLQLPLEIDETWEKHLQASFAKRGHTFSENNRKQALLPKGAKLLPNELGTAPGIWIEQDGKIIILLPGPPRELETMFVKYVLPYLPDSGSIILSRILKVIGIGEAAVENLLFDLLHSQINPTIAPLAKKGEVHLRLTAKAANKSECLKMLESMEEKIRSLLGNSVYARDQETMAEVVSTLLLKNKMTIAVAESCTGGYLAHTLTNIPGSSQYFLQGLVTYSNEAKIKMLGIEPNLIAEHGAVSEAVALAMAQNVRIKAESDIGVGITGLAGPSGGTREKPVGLVFVGLATAVRQKCQKFIFTGNRENIKERAVLNALNMVRLYLLED
ncbi:MAG: competence/damage-inducible protein A [Firmicutes bacterium]|nr:competence/damage-inducible protein A [Bacillota bacterium]